MTTLQSSTVSEPAVTLTRKDVENIVIHQMGWEQEDVDAFWFLARHGKHAGGQQ